MSDHIALMKNLSTFYEKKATFHKRFSYCSLVFIALALILGIAVFNFSASLAEDDLSRTTLELNDNLVEVQSELQYLSEGVENFSSGLNELMAFELDETPEPEWGAIVGEKAILTEMEKQFGEINQGYRLQLERLKEISKELNPSKSASKNYFIVSVTVTRIGIVTTLIFLVQILWKVYRYNQRVYFYFSAISQAFELKLNDPDSNFEKMVYILSASQFDFGKMPEGPIADAAKLAGNFNIK